MVFSFSWDAHIYPKIILLVRNKQADSSAESPAVYASSIWGASVRVSPSLRTACHRANKLVGARQSWEPKERLSEKMPDANSGLRLITDVVCACVCLKELVAKHASESLAVFLEH